MSGGLGQIVETWILWRFAVGAYGRGLAAVCCRVRFDNPINAFLGHCVTSPLFLGVSGHGRAFQPDDLVHVLFHPQALCGRTRQGAHGLPARASPL